MKQKLPENILQKLRVLEPKLRLSAKYGNFSEAERIIKIIQSLFINNRNHYRVLQAKNWFFQAALEDNRIDFAIRGFESVRIRANDNTRTYLEATILLGICHLRRREIGLAKKLIRESILRINNVTSDERRHQLQKRIIQRIELECILGQLYTESAQILNPEDLHKEAVQLLQTKSDQEIFGMVGANIPQGALELTQEIKNYSVKLLPIRDQKLLASPSSISVYELGKKAVETVKRVGWRAVCDPESEIYNLWKNQVPEFFNKGYFASAVAATCAKFSIGLPILAVGVVAILMKYSAAEFCERFRPQDIMISRNEKG
ncbi:hypothetical protein KA005_60315 [bacterium]|jgi:hypothetical protein|nr:hypothetical protein [bacterium]